MEEEQGSPEVSLSQKENFPSEDLLDKSKDPPTTTTTQNQNLQKERISTPAFGIRRLDARTSSALRKGQIVTKISDVVRELVENSVDSQAASVQVLLENFGLNKIEVRDTGCGISVSDVDLVGKGGYTSKLEDTLHLSSHKHYGFRGEALSAICSVAKVAVTTRTAQDAHATKFVLDSQAQITSQSRTAYGIGTIVNVERIFENYPVRRQWIQNKTKAAAELKEIEMLLKAVAIANPKIHINLFHNGSSIWTKASVTSVEQALMTVLGHSVTKNLERCGPVDVDGESDEVGESGKRTRRIEAFFLKKPIDMRSMSFTTNKMTFIFVNRKRVYIREIEKLIQQYTVASLEKPAPADRRRFPIAVVQITVPSVDVDFNLDMDKSKVFLVNCEQILAALEEMLKTFYEIESLEKAGESIETQSQKTSETEATTEKDTIIKETKSENKRGDNIRSFISDISVSSKENFSRSPIKLVANDHTHFPQRALTISDILSNETKSVPPKANGQLESLPTPSPSECISATTISNFNLCIDELLQDTPPDAEPKGPGVIVSVSSETNEPKAKAFVASSDSQVINVRDWIHGRVPGRGGRVLENVNIVVNTSRSSIVQSAPLTQSSNSGCGQSRNAFELIRNGFGSSRSIEERPPAPKRSRFADFDISGRNDKDRDNTSFAPQRQVTLENFLPLRENKDAALDGSNKDQRLKDSSASNSLLYERKRPRRKSDDEDSFQKPKSQNSVIALGDCLFGNRRSVKPNENENASLVQQLSSEGPANSGSLIRCLSDSMYVAKVNRILGVFHPMNCLQEFPTWKYDLNISVTNISDTGSSIGAKYAVSADSVRALFDQFLKFTDQNCEEFPKVFHKLGTVQPDLNCPFVVC